MSTETKTSLAADIGWLRLAIIWAQEQSIEPMRRYGNNVTDDLELARTRLIDRLKDQERFKVGLMERMR
jgi:hypothetical protein